MSKVRDISSIFSSTFILTLYTPQREVIAKKRVAREKEYELYELFFLFYYLPNICGRKKNGIKS